jgi:hypothetical protein
MMIVWPKTKSQQRVGKLDETVKRVVPIHCRLLAERTTSSWPSSSCLSMSGFSPRSRGCHYQPDTLLRNPFSGILYPTLPRVPSSGVEVRSNMVLIIYSCCGIGRVRIYCKDHLDVSCTNLHRCRIGNLGMWRESGQFKLGHASFCLRMEAGNVGAAVHCSDSGGMGEHQGGISKQ